MKIVIAGGAGFIGSNLAEHYSKNGADVVVIDNLRSGKPENLHGLENVKLIKESILNAKLIRNLFEKVDYLFNFAALVSVPESIENPKECVDINLHGLINVLEAAKEHKVKKAILASSAAVYGDTQKLPVFEDDDKKPQSPYGITKLTGEYFCKYYNREFGLKTASLRQFNVYGPKQDPKSQYAAAIPIFIKRALRNEDIIIYGDGTQTRDFIYVEDIAEIISLIAENENATGVFNVASGKSVTINETAELIVNLTNSKSRIIHEKERPGDIKFSEASIEKLQGQIKHKNKTSFQEGLKKTIKYFREHPEKN
jgi:UDP-glucose 4-epimerase